MSMSHAMLDMTPIVTYATDEKSVRKFTRWQEEFFGKFGMKSVTTLEGVGDGRTKVITTPLLS